jgi:hypothetical protein
LLRDAHDLLRHGGGEEQGLSSCGCLPEYGLHVLDEAHVQHLVRLVEDHGGYLREDEGLPPHVVENPPRRADDHVYPLLQALYLPLDGLAAVNRHRDDALVGAYLVQLLCHLDGKLARGHEHQGAGPFAPAPRVLLDNGNTEGGRLARAGLGHADDVLALEDGGDGNLLYLGGLFKPHV